MIQFSYEEKLVELGIYYYYETNLKPIWWHDEKLTSIKKEQLMEPW